MMTLDLKPNVQESLDFLKYIYPEGPWTITSITENPDKEATNPVIIRARTFYEHQTNDLTRHLEERNGESNLYWQINPLLRNPSAKALLHDVREVPRLHVDLDPRKGTHDREAERKLIRDLLADEARLKAHGLPGLPSLIIDSGNGYWAFWNLDHPLAVEGETVQEIRENAAEIGRYNRWIAETLNKALNPKIEDIGKEIGDTCHNIDRIARLPGTINLPDYNKLKAGYTPVIAKIYSNSPNLIYSIDQFKKSDVVSWGAGATQEDLKRIEIGAIVRILPESNDPYDIAQELKRLYPQIGDRTLELITLGEYVEEGVGSEAIKDKLDANKNLSVNRSKAHWRVNRSLQQHGVPLNVILGILCDERLPISAHAREPINDRTGRAGAKRTGRELIRFNETQIRKCAISIENQRKEDEVLTRESGEPTSKKPDVEANNSNKEPRNTNEVLRHLNERHAVLLQEGGKCRVLSWSKSELEGDNRDIAILQSFDDFRNRYMNRQIEVGRKDDQPILKPWGKVWLEHPRRKEYLELRFLPGQPEVVDGYLNLWRGFACEPIEGDWSLMRDHIFNILAEGNEEYNTYILNWAAWAVQNPDKQAEVALVFRGKMGTGKGIFARALKFMFGQHGLQINSTAHLVGKFNSHLRDCCLLFADEALAPGRKEDENILKGLITEPEIPIERKGYDVKAARSHLHIIMASNEDWVVPTSIDDRRFAIFNACESRKQDHDYFNAILNQMNNGGQSAMLHELLNRELGNWHPRSNIPQTAALMQQKERSLRPEDDLMLEILKDGVIPGEAIPNNYHCVYSNVADSNKGLFNQMRLMEPRLKNASDKLLGQTCSKFGCVRVIRYNRRGWQFPPLQEMRNNWNKIMRWDYPWDESIRDWSDQRESPPIEAYEEEALPF